MTARYRATVNVVAPATLPAVMRTDWVEMKYAAMLRKVDQHMIVSRSAWNPTGTDGVYVVTFTYLAAGDGEAVSIIHDAAHEAGAAYDAVRVTANGGRREVGR